MSSKACIACGKMLLLDPRCDMNVLQPAFLAKYLEVCLLPRLLLAYCFLQHVHLSMLSAAWVLQLLTEGPRLHLFPCSSSSSKLSSSNHNNSSSSNSSSS